MTISGAEAGLHFVATFRGAKFDREQMLAIRNEGLEITPMNKYCISEESERKYQKRKRKDESYEKIDYGNFSSGKRKNLYIKAACPKAEACCLSG